MRKNSEPFKLPTIGTQRSGSSNHRDNNKKRQSHRTANIKHIKKLENKKEKKGGQEKLMSNAYKNVINVLANFLDSKSEEKTNRKSENLDTSKHLNKSKKSIPHFQTKYRNKFQKKNLFFKPMNKLKTKLTYTKPLNSDYNKIDNESSFLSKMNKSNIEENRFYNHNKTNNIFSSLLGSEKGINHLKLKSQKSNDIYFSSLF